MAYHQAGRLAEAEQAYCQVLAKAPKNGDALQFLGALKLQQGRLHEADTLLRAALEINPRLPDAQTNHSVVLHALGRHAEALVCAEASVRVRPNHAAAQFNLGNALKDLGRFEDALASYTKGIGLQSNYADAFLNRGLVLRALGRPQDALADFMRAVALDSSMALGHMNRGVALQDLGQLDAALDAFNRAIALQSDYAEAYSNRGAVLQELKRLDEALASHNKAVALMPSFAAAYSNRAATLLLLGRAAEARDDADRAIALSPNYAEAHLNRANSLLEMRDFHGFVADSLRAAKLKPGYADAHRNAGIGLLLDGDYGRGWLEFEWRWQCKDFAHNRRPFQQPRWTGETLAASQPLLVWGEQGVGDEILYASMMRDASARVGSLIWEADPRLVPLLQRSCSNVRVVARKPDSALLSDASIAAQIPAGSLGMFLRSREADFPSMPGYLAADAERTKRLRDSFQLAAGERLIGISWSSQNPQLGHHKSIPLREWAGVLGVPRCRFVDLQYGDTSAEKAALETEAGLRLAAGGVDLRNDLDGVAALVAACDLVITVSNTTAHIAGALGIPGWVLVPAGSGKLWYWGHDREATPWYPSLRIIRQTSPGVWRDVLENIAKSLSAMP
jgi:tetratricopeptide (TPR) repeat protein